MQQNTVRTAHRKGGSDAASAAWPHRTTSRRGAFPGPAVRDLDVVCSRARRSPPEPPGLPARPQPMTWRWLRQARSGSSTLERAWSCSPGRWPRECPPIWSRLKQGRRNCQRCVCPRSRPPPGAGGPAQIHVVDNPVRRPPLSEARQWHRATAARHTPSSEPLGCSPAPARCRQ